MMDRNAARSEKKSFDGVRVGNADLKTAAGTASCGRMRRGISADALKVIAMATMVTDHVGAALFPQAELLRLIGRTAFPIYVWLLVMGFVHTSSRKKYMLQMAVCALISEVPFDLAFSGGLTFRWQNIYFSLLWGLVLMTVLEKVLDEAEEKAVQAGRTAPDPAKARGGGAALTARIVLILLLFMIPARLLHFDYGCTGPVLTAMFYLSFRTGKPALLIGFLIFSFSNLFTPVLDSVFGGTAGNGALLNPDVWSGALGTAFIECFGAAAVPLIGRYNGVRRWKRGKAFFYLFYPLHLLILYGIRTLFL